MLKVLLVVMDCLLVLPFQYNLTTRTRRYVEESIIHMTQNGQSRRSPENEEMQAPPQKSYIKSREYLSSASSAIHDLFSDHCLEYRYGNAFVVQLR